MLDHVVDGCLLIGHLLIVSISIFDLVLAPIYTRGRVGRAKTQGLMNRINLLLIKDQTTQCIKPIIKNMALNQSRLFLKQLPGGQFATNSSFDSKNLLQGAISNGMGKALTPFPHVLRPYLQQTPSKTTG